MSDLRRFEVNARSTATFGRVLCNARNHHFIIDGPVYNQCPGEEVTPVEAFLASVAACGVELVQVIARERGMTEPAVAARIEGIVDRANPVRTDLTVFNRVALEVELSGVSDEDARSLVEAFQKRCPLFGTVAAAAGEVEVTVRTS